MWSKARNEEALTIDLLSHSVYKQNILRAFCAYACIIHLLRRSIHGKRRRGDAHLSPERLSSFLCFVALREDGRPGQKENIVYVHGKRLS